MKVALVHDYLYDYGGAERVLEALKETWPEAVVYTAWVDWGWVRQNKPEWLKWQIKTSWFQHLPFKRVITSPLRFLAKWVWESLNLSDYDVVISSAAWFITKGVRTNKKQLHVSYIHTPPRYLYGLPTARKQVGLAKVYGLIINPFMRMYDFRAAQRPDILVTNSENTRRRIEKFYRREAKVIYPPVHVSTKHEARNSKQGDYFLMVNRLVGPKHVEVGILAAKLAGVNLKIVGRGPEENNLKRLAKGAKNIEFLGYVDDEKLWQLYAECKAVLYLAEEEDFGITPVEAMSFGKSVIAVNSGGVRESVVPGKTGFLLKDWDVDKLAEVLKSYKLQETSYKRQEIMEQAKKFSKEMFKDEMKELVEKEVKKIGI